MPEQQQRRPDNAAIVASIERHHERALRSEQQIREWAIVSREIIVQSRAFLLAIERAVGGAAVRAGRPRGARAPADLSARAREPRG